MVLLTWETLKVFSLLSNHAKRHMEWVNSDLHIHIHGSSVSSWNKSVVSESIVILPIAMFGEYKWFCQVKWTKRLLCMKTFPYRMIWFSYLLLTSFCHILFSRQGDWRSGKCINSFVFCLLIRCCCLCSCLWYDCGYNWLVWIQDTYPAMHQVAIFNWFCWKNVLYTLKWHVTTPHWISGPWPQIQVFLLGYDICQWSSNSHNWLYY